MQILVEISIDGDPANDDPQSNLDIMMHLKDLNECDRHYICSFYCVLDEIYWARIATVSGTQLVRLYFTDAASS